MILVDAMDGVEIFPYGAMGEMIRTQRTPAGIGADSHPCRTAFGRRALVDGGADVVCGLARAECAHGHAADGGFEYKFAGPWDFFFERLVFQKLWLSYSMALTCQIADWRSQVVLGQSVNSLTGAGDTVTGTTTTNLMSLAQQLKEIAAVLRDAEQLMSRRSMGWAGRRAGSFNSTI